MDRDPWCLPRSVVFSRDKKAGEIDRALPVLEDATAAARHTRDGGGRPVYANRPKGERTDDYYVRTGNSTRQLTRSRSSTTPRRAGRGDRRYETDCGRVLGHNGGIPGFLNDLYSSEDGTHQFGLMINAEAAPQAVGQPYFAALEQELSEAFGRPCRFTQPSAAMQEAPAMGPRGTTCTSTALLRR